MSFDWFHQLSGSSVCSVAARRKRLGLYHKHLLYFPLAFLICGAAAPRWNDLCVQHWLVIADVFIYLLAPFW